MSSYRGNSQRCPHCAITYKRFRTGFSYADVYQMMWTHPQKRRRTILGAWHQLKKELWSRHIDVDCEHMPLNKAALQEVPF